jgi:hypothetical protein
VSPVKRKKATTRVMKQLPGNFHGRQIFVLLNSFYAKISHSFIIGFETGLMGKANLRYVRNEEQAAINLCMEVIQQVQYSKTFTTTILLCIKDYVLIL